LAERAREHGLAALKVKHSRQSYTPELKLNVVCFYDEYHMGILKVATAFITVSSNTLAYSLLG